VPQRVSRVYGIDEAQPRGSENPCEQSVSGIVVASCGISLVFFNFLSVLHNLIIPRA
jgi:hypothetical protein